jgi:hypothetical protein
LDADCGNRPALTACRETMALAQDGGGPMSEQDGGCPDLEPGELEAIEAEDKRKERIARDRDRDR